MAGVVRIEVDEVDVDEYGPPQLVCWETHCMPKARAVYMKVGRASADTIAERAVTSAGSDPHIAKMPRPNRQTTEPSANSRFNVRSDRLAIAFVLQGLVVVLSDYGYFLRAIHAIDDLARVDEIGILEVDKVIQFAAGEPAFTHAGDCDFRGNSRV